MEPLPWMEPLWNPVVATGGNQRQIDEPRKRQNEAKFVATGCHRLPATFHGKEGVDGSSPSEGFAKAPHNWAFCFGSTCRFSNVGQVWSPLWSLQVENALLESRVVRLRSAQPRGRRFIAGARYGPISDPCVPVESLVEWPPKLCQRPRRAESPWFHRGLARPSLAADRDEPPGVRTYSGPVTPALSQCLSHFQTRAERKLP